MSFENTETFTLNLSGATNASISDGQGIATITDDDSQPTVSIENTSVVEGNNNTKTVTFTVRLSVASGNAITVGYTTANGTALAGSDYVAKSGSITIAAGAATGTITVEVVGDRVREGTESFNVNLTSATGATLGATSGVCTITDND